MSATQKAVGKYRLLRKLATGGMAEVYLAQAAGPAGFQKTLVLKRILPHLAEDSQFVEMFLNEARLAALLNHPNIVQIFDLGEAADSYFIAMEYLDGPNLRGLARRANEKNSPIPYDHAVKIIALACEGLQYAHDFEYEGKPLQLIHRDISPDNILVSRAGSVKLVDFGIAKAANQTSQLTQTGTLKGKLAYMPPEQLRGTPLDRRADIFSLGVVLYELLTGMKPFEATSEVASMQAILHDPPTPLAERRPDCPPELQPIIDKALAKDRDQRYPDCHSLQRDLDKFLMARGAQIGAYELSKLITELVPPAATQSRLTPVPSLQSSLPQEIPSLEPVEPRPKQPPALPSGPPALPSRPKIKPASLDQLLNSDVDPTMVKTETGTAVNFLFRYKRLALIGGGAALGIVGAIVLGLSFNSAPAKTEAGGGAAASPTPAPGASAAAPAAPEARPAEPAAPAPAGESAAATATDDSAAQAGVAAQAPAPPAKVDEGSPEKAEPRKSEARATTKSPKREQRVASAAPAAKPSGATLVVEAELPCQVLVNGVAKGNTPLKLGDLAPGDYDITVVNRDRGLQKQLNVTLSAGETQRERVTFGSGTLSFRVRPWANVEIDGKPYGTTPLPEGVKLLEGQHKVRLFNPDLKKEHVRTVVITAGKDELIKLNLED